MATELLRCLRRCRPQKAAGAGCRRQPISPLCPVLGEIQRFWCKRCQRGAEQQQSLRLPRAERPCCPPASPTPNLVARSPDSGADAVREKRRRRKSTVPRSRGGFHRCFACEPRARLGS